MLLVKSFVGKELARQLNITCLLSASNLIIASMGDRPTVNTVSIHTLSIVFPTSLAFGVFPLHTTIWESIKKILFLMILLKDG